MGIGKTINEKDKQTNATCLRAGAAGELEALGPAADGEKRALQSGGPLRVKEPQHKRSGGRREHLRARAQAVGPALELGQRALGAAGCAQPRVAEHRRQRVVGPRGLVVGEYALY